MIAQSLALVYHLRAIEVGKLHNIVYEVGVFDVRWLVDHPHIVKDEGLFRHELQEDNAHRPHIRLVTLLAVTHYRLQRHECQRPHLVFSDYSKTVYQLFINFKIGLVLTYILAFRFGLLDSLLKGSFVLNVDLC